MSERDFVERLGDELTSAARRQAARRGAGWRRLLPGGAAHRVRGRALVLVGAVALVGAGGTAGLLAARGEVGGPPSLTFVRLSPDQLAAGVRPLTRPVVFARGHLAYDGRPWQLVGFQTTRGLCVEIDFPQQQRAGGCGTPEPRGGRRIDWQAQIAIARLARGLVLGAVDPAAATVDVRHGAWRRVHPKGAPFPVPVPSRGLVAPRVAPARVIHVHDPRLLRALGLRRPFAYWIAELEGPYYGMRASARDAHGELLGRAGVPYAMNDTSRGISFTSHVCGGGRFDAHRRPRLVSTLPPRAIREQIAALRRPQQPSDRLPARVMDVMTSSPLAATIEVDAIRLLRTTADGERLYLVAMTQRAFDAAPPPGCLRTLTPRQRARDVTLRRRALALARTVRVTVYGFDRRGRGGTVAGFLPDLYRRGRAGYGSGGGRLAGMAPDGVAKVELRYRDGARWVVPVVGNVWLAPVGRARSLPWRGPRAVLWLAADGRVLRRLR